MRSLLGLVVTGMLFTSAPEAATFHVAPEGDDQSDGSQGSPFRTIQRAATGLAAGDEVIVAAGRYAGFTLEDLHGSPHAPVIVRGMPGAIVDVPGPIPKQPPVNSATGNTDWPAWPAGIAVLRSSHVVIEGFRVENMPGAITVGGQLAHKGGMGFRLEACRHVTLRDNVADNNGRWGIFSSFCDDLVIERNETSRSQIEHGIYLSNSGDRPILRHNRSWGNNLCGIQLNADNNWHDDFYARFATVDGIISGAHIEGNILLDNGRGGGAGINGDGLQDSRIVNNLIADNHASGIALYQVDGREGARRNQVINNTILMPADGRFAIVMLTCPDVGADGACKSANEPFLPSWAKPTAQATGSTGNILLNNIIHHASATKGGAIDTDAQSLAVDGVSGAALRSDHNAFVGRFRSGAQLLDFAAWRDLTGGDGHSFTSTPGALLMAPEAGDFNPRPDGPAIDAGTTDLAPGLDLAGHPRPVGGGIDLGAYEHCVGAECLPEAPPEPEPEAPDDEGDAPEAGSAGAPASESAASEGVGSDCGCRNPGVAGAGAGLFAALAAAVFGLFRLRRRRRAPHDG